MKSRFEREYAVELEKMVEAGEIRDFRTQQTVHILSPVTGHEICKYLCDFKVEHFDGVIEWIETKDGHEDALWQIKAKLMRELYAPSQLNEIFSVARRRRTGKPDYLPKRRVV